MSQKYFTRSPIPVWHDPALCLANGLAAGIRQFSHATIVEEIEIDVEIVTVPLAGIIHAMVAQ